MANSYPIKYTHSGMAGSPVISGQVGKIIETLDAVLINGFNNKAALDFIIDNNVATLVFNTGHGFEVGQIVLVSGSSNVDLNTEHYVTSVTFTTISFIDIPQGLPNGSVGGTVSCKVAPQGTWQKVYAATNIAVYRCTDVTSTRLYLRVNDTIGDYATVNMYETMTGVSTGTAKSINTFWFKSNAADSTSREWTIIAEKNIFYFLVFPVGSSYLNVNSFGDIVSFKSGDAYKCWLCGNDAYYSYDFLYLNNSVQSNFLARGYYQTGGVVSVTKIGLGPQSDIGSGGSNSYPSAVDNSLMLYAPILVSENNQIRGIAPGIIQPIQNNTTILPNRLVFSNIPELPNRNVVILHDVSYVIMFDITGPWR